MSVYVQLEFPHDCPHRDHDGGPCNYQAGGIRQYRRHLVVRHGLGLSTRGRRVSYHQLDTAPAERRRYLQANRQGGRAESRRAFRRRHPVARRPLVTDSDGSSSVSSATPSRRRQPRPADYRSTPTSSEHLTEGGETNDTSFSESDSELWSAGTVPVELTSVRPEPPSVRQVYRAATPEEPRLEHDLGTSPPRPLYSPLRPLSPAADAYHVDDVEVEATTYAPPHGNVPTSGGVGDDVCAAPPVAAADGAIDADGGAPLLVTSAADDVRRDDSVTHPPHPSADEVPVDLMSVPPVDLEHFAVLCSRFMWCNSTAPVDAVLHEVMSASTLGNQVNAAQRRALELALHFGAELVRQHAILVRQDLISHFGHLHTVDPNSMLSFMIDQMMVWDRRPRLPRSNVHRDFEPDAAAADDSVHVHVLQDSDDDGIDF